MSKMADFDIFVQERLACRTCGFTDCPGASGGDCPRWPEASDPPEFEPEPDDDSWAYDYWVTDEIWADAAREYGRELLADR
jgi:hypothetical protein